MPSVLSDEDATGDIRIGLLLGAGASYDADLPLLADLTAKVRDALSPSLRELYGVLEESELPPWEAGGRNIEDILTSADAFSSARLSYRTFRPRDFSLLAIAIRSEIWRQLTRPVKTGYLEPLSRLIASQRFGLPIFSLNNDLVIESWCEEKGIPLVDGFQGAKAFDASSFATVEAPVSLCKLHGSVDWRQDLTPGILRFRGLFESSRGDIALRSPVPDATLVFPSRTKLITDAALIELLLWFRRSLDRLDILVVVGCQLGDPHVLQSIFDSLGKREGLRILFIDPKPYGVLNRIFPSKPKIDLGGRIDVLRLGFGKALEGPLFERLEALGRKEGSAGIRLWELLRKFPSADATVQAHRLAHDLRERGITALEAEEAQKYVAEILPDASVDAPFIRLLRALSAALESQLGDMAGRIAKVLDQVGRRPGYDATACAGGLAVGEKEVYFVSNEDHRVCSLEDDWTSRCVGPKINDPGGIALLDESIFVVQRMWRQFLGMGSLREISLVTGQMRAHLLNRAGSAVSSRVHEILNGLRSLRDTPISDRSKVASAERLLLDLGFISWPTAVEVLDDERLVVLESVKANVVSLNGWTVERSTNVELINLSDCAVVSGRGILLLEGGVDREGQILYWDLVANTLCQAYDKPIYRGGGISYIDGRVLLTIAKESPWGEVWEFSMASNGTLTPKNNRPLVSRLHNPTRLRRSRSGQWFCLSRNGVLHLDLG